MKDEKTSAQGIGDESFEEVLNHLAAGVVVLADTGSGLRVLYASRRAAAIFEATVEEIERSIDDTHLLGDYSVPSANFLSQLSALEGDAIVESVVRGTTTTGRMLWVSLLAAVAIVDGARRYYITLRDVTERTEEERRMVWREAKYRILSHSSDVILFDYDPAVDVCTLELTDTRGKQTERAFDGLKSRIRAGEYVTEMGAQTVLTGIDTACIRPGRGSFDFEMNGAGGMDGWRRAAYTSIAGEDGRVYRVVGRIDDITEERNSARSRRFALMRDESFRATLLADAYIAAEFDLSTRRRIELELSGEDGYIPSQIMLADFKRSIRMQPIPLDVTLEDFVGIMRGTYMDPEQHEGFDEYLASLRNMAGRTGIQASSRGFEARMLPLDDSYTGYRWMRIECAYLPSRATGHTCLLFIMRDIDAAKKRELSLVADARHDALTGLLNRSAFELEVRSALGRCDGDRHLGAFLIFDLDDFKGINDTLGHDAGDRAIKSMATRLMKAFRSNDIVGRFGGDEFLVFMTNLPNADVVEAKASGFCHEAARTSLPGTEVSLSCSCGAAVYRCDGEDYSSLFKDADAALYDSKNKGKGTATIFAR